MRRAPAVVIALFMVVISLVVLVVAWAGISRGDRLDALEASNREMRVELDKAKRDLIAAHRDVQTANARAVAAEIRADRLQARVDALETALRRHGLDPATVVVVQTTHHSSPTAAPAPVGPPGSPRPAPTSPAPRPSPSPSPTCLRLPIVGCH